MLYEIWDDMKRGAAMNNIQKFIKKFKLNVIHIDGVPESYSSEVYRLTLSNQQQVYLKIPFNKVKLYREFAMLQRLAGKLPVPRVHHYWEGDDEVTGALLLESIPGLPITGVIPDKLAYEIGSLQAQMHSVNMPGYGYDTPDGFHGLPDNNWRSYIRWNFENCKPICLDILEPGLYERCVAYFNKAYSTLPEPDSPCVVHLDFRPGNLLVQDHKITGIIDFESSRGGSSEIDFTKVNRYIWERNPATREIFEEGYNSIKTLIDLKRTLPFYSLYDSFCGVAWCAKRGVDKHKAFLNENLDELKKITNSLDEYIR